MKVNVRKATNKLYEMMEDGVLDAEAIVVMCLAYMSEDDVADMCHANEIPIEDEDEDEDEDEAS